MSRRSTFVLACHASDNIERETVAPIADELSRRHGWRVIAAKHPDVESDLALFASHGSTLFDFEHSEWRQLNSRFKVVVVHDFDQAGEAGINFFAHEGWGRFDLGLVPGPRQVELAKNGDTAGLALPRYGVSGIGWPKADRALQRTGWLTDRAGELRAQLALAGRPILLLACSWSTPRQLRDLLEATREFEVDVVCRYPKVAPRQPGQPWTDALAEARTELADAVRFARSQPHVRVTGPETDLYASLAVADVVISNGSNVVYESILMDTPAISVTSWHHRGGERGFDTVEPFVDLGGVANCSAADLSATIERFLTNDLSPYVALGRNELVPPGSLGKAAALAADRIEAAMTAHDVVPELRKVLADTEYELAAARARIAELESRFGSVG